LTSESFTKASGSEAAGVNGGGTRFCHPLTIGHPAGTNGVRKAVRASMTASTVIDGKYSTVATTHPTPESRQFDLSAYARNRKEIESYRPSQNCDIGEDRR